MVELILWCIVHFLESIMADQLWLRSIYIPLNNELIRAETDCLYLYKDMQIDVNEIFSPHANVHVSMKTCLEPIELKLN